MKKCMKILSLALAFALLLSVAVLPATAANATATVEVKATYQGKVSSGQDYYKFSVWIDSTHAMNAYQLNISWEDNVWQPLRADTKADSKLINKNLIDQNDVENIMYKAHPNYALYGMEGTGDGAWIMDYNADGYAYMPADQAGAPSMAKLSDTNLGADLKNAGYVGLYSAWAGDFTDQYLCLSGGTINQANSPTGGKVMVLSWYMRLKDNAPAGAHEVGFNARQAYQMTAQINRNDQLTTKMVSDDLEDIKAGNVSYTNAIVTVGDAAPVLNKDGRQVKMSVQSGAVVKGTEQLRVISSISKADWDANFAQTATADTTKNAIQKVGIVANNGTVPFDMTTAQNVAKGTPANGYSVAETTYIQQAADDTYKFGARIEYKTDVYDTTYVAFVEYTDAQGVTQYMFYDAEASVAFKTNYKTITDQYIAKFPG